VDSPRALVEGAETLFFLGLFALGFRNSRFGRFWPLAISVSVGARSHAQPHCLLRGQGSTKTRRGIVVLTSAVLAFPLNSKCIGFEVARHFEEGSRSDVRTGAPGEAAAAGCLFAQLIRCLVSRRPDAYHARLFPSFFATTMRAA
jgi:hypothetical protein